VNLQKIREFAATLLAVSAAMTLVMGLVWKLYLEERIEGMLLDSEGRTAYKVGLVVDALAIDDSLSIEFFAKHGFPEGPRSE